MYSFQSGNGLENGPVSDHIQAFIGPGVQVSDVANHRPITFSHPSSISGRVVPRDGAVLPVDRRLALLHLSGGKTETVIAQFREQTRGSLSDENFCGDLKHVGTSWRRSLQCALITRAGDRAPANEVLEAFSRGIQGKVSTVSRTRGMAVLSQELAAVFKGLAALSKGQAAISANQHEVLRRTGTMSSDMRRVLGRVATMSTVLEQLAVDELRMPHTFLVFPEENSKLPRPKQWLADRGRLHFVCAHGLEHVSYGLDGTGFLVSQLKVSGGSLSAKRLHTTRWRSVKLHEFRRRLNMVELLATFE